MRSLVRWWRERHETPEQQEARSLRAIRAHFAALGYDLSDITDDEIRDGVRRFSQLAAASGVTLSQAAQSLAWLAQARPSLVAELTMGRTTEETRALAEKLGSPQQTGPKRWTWPPSSGQA